MTALRNSALTLALAAFPLTLTAQTPAPAPAPTQEKKKEEPLPLPPGTKLEANVPYVQGGDERQVMDIFLPPGEGPFPFVLYLHGGGLKIGSKDWARKEAVANLIPAGIAVAAINYRFVTKAPWPAPIEDTLLASKWLKANGAAHGLDVNRAGTWGYSAGAMLSALLATTEDSVTTFGPADAQPADYLDLKATVIWAGRVDLTNYGPMQEKELKTVAGYFGGGKVEDHVEKEKQASSLHYITPQDGPFMLVHGDKDIHANVAQVAIWEKALKAANVPVTIDIMPGATHDIPLDYSYTKLVEFLKSNGVK
jgi:acetyl esterase/lipase